LDPRPRCGRDARDGNQACVPVDGRRPVERRSDLRSRKVRDALRWSYHGPRVLVRGAVELFALFRGGGLAESMEPWLSCGTVDDVHFEKIAAEGMSDVLFDLDQ